MVNQSALSRISVQFNSQSQSQSQSVFILVSFVSFFWIRRICGGFQPTDRQKKMIKSNVYWKPKKRTTDNTLTAHTVCVLFAQVNSKLHTKHNSVLSRCLNRPTDRVNFYIEKFQFASVCSDSTRRRQRRPKTKTLIHTRTHTHTHRHRHTSIHRQPRRRRRRRRQRQRCGRRRTTALIFNIYQSVIDFRN